LVRPFGALLSIGHVVLCGTARAARLNEPDVGPPSISDAEGHRMVGSRGDTVLPTEQSISLVEVGNCQ
jgi:hypothetical protein